MFRYRKLWMIVAGIIMVLVLVTSFLKPDLVTVVPNQDQLEQKPDLQLQPEENQSGKKDQHEQDKDSLDNVKEK